MEDLNGQGSKAIPIHCIVEKARRQEGRLLLGGSTNQSSFIREHDTYVIVPSHVPVGDLVRIALVRIGYTASEGLRARGYIQVKNWKPLSFESITDNLETSVEEILGELLPVATLWVRITSDSALSAFDDIRDKLLHLLLQRSHGLLSGCPLEKRLLTDLTRGDVSGLTPERQTTFNKWYQEQTTRRKLQTTATISPPPAADPAKLSNLSGLIAVDPASASPSSPQNSGFPVEPGDKDLGYALTSETTPAKIPDYRSLTPPPKSNNNDVDDVDALQYLHRCYTGNPNPSVAHKLSSMRCRKEGFLASAAGVAGVASWFEAAKDKDKDSRGPASVDSGSAGSDADEEEDGEETSKVSEEMEEGATGRVSGKSSPMRGRDLRERQPENNYLEMDDSEMFRAISAGNDWPEQPDSEGRCTSGARDDYIRCGTRHPPSGDLVRRRILSDEEANDLTIRTGNELRPGGKNCEQEQREEEEEEEESSTLLFGSRALSVKTEVVGSRGGGGHFRKTQSACASPLAVLPYSSAAAAAAVDPSAAAAAGESGGGFSLHRPCTPIQLRYFRHQHIMRLQAAMSQALNLHCMQHPGMYHHPHHPHPSFESGPMLLPGGPGPRGAPYKDPNRLSPADSGVSDGDRRKRSRVFIDPLTEIPRLERWFTEDTHPSAYMIEQFTDELNRSPYRQRFPPLEPKNVQLWFKNHRAKVKRQKIELSCRGGGGGGSPPPSHHDSSATGDGYAGAMSRSIRDAGSGSVWTQKELTDPIPWQSP